MATNSVTMQEPALSDVLCLISEAGAVAEVLADRTSDDEPTNQAAWSVVRSCRNAREAIEKRGPARASSSDDLVWAETEEEREFLRLFRELSAEGKQAMLALMQATAKGKRAATPNSRTVLRKADYESMNNAIDMLIEATSITGMVAERLQEADDSDGDAAMSVLAAKRLTSDAKNMLDSIFASAETAP